MTGRLALHLLANAGVLALAWRCGQASLRDFDAMARREGCEPDDWAVSTIIGLHTFVAVAIIWVDWL